MDQKFIDMAKAELGEDDFKRTQSLQQFHDWLSKHPFLSEVRQDDTHLLAFLRSRKFNMDATFEHFENFYLAPKRYPQLFQQTDENIAKSMKLFESGVCYPLSERDDQGRRIILMQYSRLDTNLYTAVDFCQLLVMVITIVLDEPESQIAGVVTIHDSNNITMKHLFTPTEAKDFFNYTKMSAPMRQKGNFLVNFPPFAGFILEMMKFMLSEKLKKRIVAVKSWDEIKTHMNPALLPKELGGQRSEADMMQDFRKLLDQRMDFFLKIAHAKVDWSKVSPEKLRWEEDTEAVGSFRKLEID